MKKLYLVDISSIFFRAYYAIPNSLTNEEGLPTNALYGFMSMTIKLLRDVRPDYLVFCFDRKEASFRHDMYEDYKANRSEMPEDLGPQIPYIQKLTDALGIPRMDKLRYEADDLIGSLTKWGRQQNLEVVIVSGDKDFAQLVEPMVSMYDSMKEVRYDSQGVRDKWGVSPEQMIDYLALVGDSSDNIPGVRGIGPKGAQKLLGDFGSLDGIYQNLDKISGKSMKAKLIEHKDQAYLSQKLVTIQTDLELCKDLSELQLKEVDREGLKNLLLFLGFKTFVKSLLEDREHWMDGDKVKSSPASEASRSSSKVEGGMADLPTFEESTVSLQELDQLVEPYTDIWAMWNERGMVFAASNRILRVTADPQEVGQVLNKKNLQWKGFDLKEIWRQLKLENPKAGWDTMLAAYIIRPSNIESLAEVYTHFSSEKFPDLISFPDLFRIHQWLEKELGKLLKKQSGDKVFWDMELPLIPVLFEMEKKGILLNKEDLSEQAQILEKDLRDLEKVIHAEAGGSFNIGSPKQMAEVLFVRMGLTRGKKTKTGYSTNSDVLEKLVHEHPIAQHILDYRELAKLKSTYVDALPSLVDPLDGRIHSNFRQAATATGRLSSVNPNLQNIPIRTERGRQVRRAFVAAPGCDFISADYSQIELRVLAHITGDEGLCKAFEEDQDVHAITASEIFDKPIREIDADLRRVAKAVNFGIAYGQGVFGLAETLGISRGEASEIIEKYFKRFKRVREYMSSVIQQAQSQGYVETLFGRRRYLDELKSKNPNIRKFGERAAINAPIQGTASDLVKMAMIQLHEEIPVPMILQVHDELLFECPQDEVEEHCPYIKKIMESTSPLKVPLKVNIASGPNWEDAHS